MSQNVPAFEIYFKKPHIIKFTQNQIFKCLEFMYTFANKQHGLKLHTKILYSYVQYYIYKSEYIFKMFSICLCIDTPLHV